MDLGNFLGDLGLSRLAVCALVGLPRLITVVAFCPFLASNVFSAHLKGTLILVFSFVIAPTVLHQVPQTVTLGVDGFKYLLLAVKEAILGYLLGFTAGIVFWTIQSAGFLMDNQRGASMAVGPDPLSGEETSPLGSFLFQGIMLVFFTSGAILTFLDLFFGSYVLWPVATFWPNFNSLSGAKFFLHLADWLMLQTFLLAGPVVAAALLTDVSLGLINRFASQLNVYILAMPIKSGLAMFILVSYYAFLINLSPELFQKMFHQLSLLRLLEP